VEAGARDVVVALSLDGFQLAAIPGINYEERMLFTLGLLRHPRARLVYVTSQPLNPAVLEYFLALIGGIPTAHVRERLTMIACYDTSPRPLTEKILERPRLIERIRQVIDPERAHMSVFTVSERERRLAVKLGIPLYGVDPSLLALGERAAPARLSRGENSDALGVETLQQRARGGRRDRDAVEEDPKLRRVVVKLNQGFLGKATPSSAGQRRPGSPRCRSASRAVEAIAEALPEQLRFMSDSETYVRFEKEMQKIGGVVEVYLEGKRKRSPSAQLRINPRGSCRR
jgi:hypothetical protein